MKNFANLDSDENRFKFVHNLDGVRIFNELKCTSEKSKNAVLALELKKRGNLAFQAKHWTAALELYNKCQLITPPENGMIWYSYSLRKNKVMYLLLVVTNKRKLLPAQSK